MKSPAPKQFALLAVILILAGEHVLASGQSNQCKCAEPPGGTVTCEEGQIPICIVKDGKVTSTCKSLPDEPSKIGPTLSQRNAWLLSTIMGKEVTVAELKHNQEYQKILLEGRSVSAQAQISFLPIGPSIKDLKLEPAGDLAYVRSNNVMKMMRNQRLSPDPQHKFIGKFEAPYEEGKELLSGEQYEKALTAFQAARLGAIEINSKTQLPLAIEGIGQVLYELGRYDEATKAFQEAVLLAPNDPDLLDELGTILRFANKYLEAAEVFEKAIKLRPDNYESHASLGFVSYALGKYVEAERAFMSAVRLRPDYADVYAALGNTFYSEHKLLEASEAFKRAVQLRPDDTVSYGKLGSSLYQLGEYAGAENAFMLGIRLKPDSASFYGELGRVLYTRLKYSEAALAFKRAVELDPAKAYFHIGLGDALYAQGETRDAQVEYRLALDLDPKNSIFRDRLSRAGGRTK